MALAETLMHLI